MGEERTQVPSIKEKNWVSGFYLSSSFNAKNHLLPHFFSPNIIPQLKKIKYHPSIHPSTHPLLFVDRKGEEDKKEAQNLLPPKRASLRQTSFSTSRLAQNGRAAAADDDGLGVREDGRDGEAAGAFDVHEEGAGGGHESLFIVGLHQPLSVCLCSVLGNF